MKNLYQLLRINHYIKNLIIFAPLLFTREYENIQNIENILTIFFIFCIIASTVYIFNDLVDLKFDKLHPKKNKKPLANNQIKEKTAYQILIFLCLISLVIVIRYQQFLIIIASYFILNILYSTILKKIFLIDIFILSTNYIIRVLAGCIALSVDLSNWMAITVFCGALTLSSIKRKKELLIYGSKARPVLKKYTVENLKNISLISAILTIIFYSLYVIFLNENFLLTIPLVIYSVIRYLIRSENKNFLDSPVEEILRDKQNFLLAIIWVSMIIFLGN